MSEKCPECGQVPAGESCPVNNPLCPTFEYKPPTEAPEKALLGTVIGGRYVIESVLGKGGFGTVFAAHHVTTKQHIVIKVLDARMSADRTQVQRFYNEAQMTSQLSHPNTVRVFDFGVTGSGLLFIAMERLEGRELSDVMKEEGRLDPIRTARIACAILRSLSEAHSIGLVHRDLKPGNIFLCQVHGEKDFVKLLDFGIAKDTDGGEESDLTKTGFAVGTPKYMSPEQGRADKLDRRSDLYSLGVIMYEALCGEAPFKAPSAMSLIVKHMQEVPRGIDERVQGLPDGLAMVVMTALKKSPAARFFDADDMRAALEIVLERVGEGVPKNSRAMTAKMRGLTPDVVSAALTAAGTAASVAETREVELGPSGDGRTAAENDAGEAETRALPAGHALASAVPARAPDQAQTRALPTPAAVQAAKMPSRSASGPRRSQPVMEEIGAGSVMPASPSRPARNRPKSRDGGRPFSVAVAVVALLGIGGVVGWRMLSGRSLEANVVAGRARAMAAGREAVDFTKRASKAAVSAAKEAIHSPDQRRGVRDLKGPKFRKQLAARQLARKKQVASARAAHKSPPLTKQEIDRVGERNKGALRSCYLKKVHNPANYKRIRIDVRIDPRGRVMDASFPDADNDALAACFEKAIKRVRFRGNREEIESHQLFVNLGRVKTLRNKPVHHRAPRRAKPTYDGDKAL